MSGWHMIKVVFKDEQNEIDIEHTLCCVCLRFKTLINFIKSLQNYEENYQFMKKGLYLPNIHFLILLKKEGFERKNIQEITTSNEDNL